jgi:hypothetical protein
MAEKREVDQESEEMGMCRHPNTHHSSKLGKTPIPLPSALPPSVSASCSRRRIPEPALRRTVRAAWKKGLLPSLSSPELPPGWLRKAHSTSSRPSSFLSSVNTLQQEVRQTRGQGQLPG